MEKELLSGEKYKYQVDLETNIVYKIYYGKITLNDIITSWDDIIKSKKLPQEISGYILDYRAASFYLNEGEHLGIAEYYKNNLSTFKNKKIAILTDKPEDIIVPILVEKEDYMYLSKPFTTLNAAINWVLL